MVMVGAELRITHTATLMRDGDSRERPRAAPLEEEEMEGEDRGDQPRGPEHRRKKHRNPSEMARSHHRSRSPERGEDRRQRHRVSPAFSSRPGSSGYGQSPPWSTRPRLMTGDRHRRPAEAGAAHRRPGEGPSDAPHARRGLSQDHRLGAPHGSGAGSQSRGHQPHHGDKRPVGAKGHETSSALISKKSSLDFSRQKSPRPPLSLGHTKENPPSSGVKKEKEREGHGIQFSPPFWRLSHHLKKRKHEDSVNTKWDKNKRSLDRLDAAECSGGLLPKVKEKISNNQKIQTGKMRPPVSDGKPVGGSLSEDTDNEFKPPTMSLESHLNHDQPREKKIRKTSATALEEKGLKKNDSSENLDSVQELSKVNKNKSGKLPPPGNDWAKLKKVPPDALPVWPDLPLPRVQAKYRPLPAFELMSSFRPKQKALPSPQKEEAVGFTGRRMNSKMQVYSGSKCAYLPKMMTLRQQCIWVLKNNINSIFKVGGVPYSVLEPILKSCAPDQLYRIEKYNHALVKETDKLWKIHCHQNFRKERPKEDESWREMYLRLQDAREQRLRALAVNIQSAHANKPKGRQAQMILFNSVARPPADVRRRQKFEIGGAAVPEKVKIKPAPYPTGGSHAPSNNSLDLIHEKPAYACPSTTSTHLMRVVSSRKPAKKIAPMMAKAIKDFKNRFSR
uniref:Elongin-A n=2 Tax=Camelus bactrianus TaxID=9837 RepID=A0A9W3HLB7_CAMBA|nr:elongin-A-like [Camelus bactrianus]